MPTLEERFSIALHHTARVWRHAIDTRLKDLGVGQAGWMAIAAVAKAGAPVSQTALATLLSIEGPSVVATVDRLVKAGLAERVASATDRRIKHVTLTAAGEAMYKKVSAEAAAFRKETLSDVDRAALEAATTTLEALRARIEAQYE
ncbi:MAG: MarR family winged helix-turn-helix transcriptional regulator [Massilia sp.]